MTVLAIAGPTASGKTALAVEIACRFDAVIVSSDAMQVYRGMDIGTGKACMEERAGVPHFGIDVRDPDEDFDASNFVQLAQQALSSNEHVLIAGGTSLYLQALRRGLVQTPRPDPQRRAIWQERSDLHEALSLVDPQLAERLHPNDRGRLIRGLEVWEDLGVRLSDLQAEHAAQPDRVDVQGVWLDRHDLDERIDSRVLEMMERGYRAEVETLLDRYDRGLKPMRSLGYRHLASHLLDGLKEEEAVRLTQRDTRRFARKQRTWRRHLGLPPGDREAAFALAETMWGRV